MSIRPTAGGLGDGRDLYRRATGVLRRRLGRRVQSREFGFGAVVPDRVVNRLVRTMCWPLRSETRALTRLLFALIGTVLAFAVCRAEQCVAPNVARTVTRPPETNVAAVYHIPVLHCPAVGACWMAPVFEPPPPPVVDVICLTPGQEAEARAR